MLVCLPMACTQPQGQPVTAAKPVASADPPPAFHAYPEIPPDQLAAEPEAETCQALPAPPPASRGKATRVASGPPVTNHIPPGIIMRAMRARAFCLRQCYELSPTYTPAVSGRVAVKFVIDADGYVRKSKVHELDTLAASVGQCVTQQIVGMEFPRPEGGPVTVIYPFRFGPP